METLERLKKAVDILVECRYSDLSEKRREEYAMMFLAASAPLIKRGGDAFENFVLSKEAEASREQRIKNLREIYASYFADHPEDNFSNEGYLPDKLDWQQISVETIDEDNVNRPLVCGRLPVQVCVRKNNLTLLKHCVKVGAEFDIETLIEESEFLSFKDITKYLNSIRGSYV